MTRISRLLKWQKTYFRGLMPDGDAALVSLRDEFAEEVTTLVVGLRGGEAVHRRTGEVALVRLVESAPFEDVRLGDAVVGEAGRGPARVAPAPGDRREEEGVDLGLLDEGVEHRPVPLIDKADRADLASNERV